MRRTTTGFLALALSLAVAIPAIAADSPVLGKKLVITDTTPKNGKSKAVFIVKDAGVAKGAAGDPALLDGSLQFFYVDSPANESTMLLPLGDWDKNTDQIARYKNVTAPVGGEAKVALVKPGKVAKVVAKDKGTIDISSPPGAGGVIAALTVNNGNDASQTRMCTLFSVGSGSSIKHKAIAGGLAGYKLILKNGVGSACPADCSDGVQNGDETDVDCGGSFCGACSPGQGCDGPSDCTSLVCTGNVCQAPTCADGVLNQDETDIDCGGSCGATCAFGQSCSGGGDCVTGTCSGGVCNCGSNKIHTFSHNSNSGGVFDSAEWQGGTQAHNFSTGCTVSIENPTGNIDLVGALGDNFGVTGSGNFVSCFGSGAEDGDGCDVTSCPPAGIGSCAATRPSCSAALNGSGTATYRVECDS